MYAISRFGSVILNAKTFDVCANVTSRVIFTIAIQPIQSIMEGAFEKKYIYSVLSRRTIENFFEIRDILNLFRECVEIYRFSVRVRISMYQYLMMKNRNTNLYI